MRQASAGSPFIALASALSNSTFAVDTAVTTLTNGNYVVLGRAFEGDSGYYMRIFNASGGSVLPFTEVSGTIGNGESDSQGFRDRAERRRLRVAWANIDSSDTDIFFQIYNAAGSPVGGQIAVNSGGSTDNNNEPSVIGLSDGGFVVVYDDDESDTVRMQRYDASGLEVGVEVIVTDSPSKRRRPSPDFRRPSSGRLDHGKRAATPTSNSSSTTRANRRSPEPREPMSSRRASMARRSPA